MGHRPRLLVGADWWGLLLVRQARSNGGNSAMKRRNATVVSVAYGVALSYLVWQCVVVGCRSVGMGVRTVIGGRRHACA